tara:strand:+ start:6302 stop:8383 length:2082 start_codon:yes stop_codon:yes gene_type:complete
MLVSAAAQAAEDNQAGVPEIIVTAQKRSENVQDIPLAVSAVSSSQLARLGIANVTDLGAAVPNLNIQDSNGRVFIYLRGVGNNFLGLGTESNVAYHSNGVYIARPRAQVASFFDVDHIEVVRGPQGDLYGRNATGGSINVITRKPTQDASLDVSLSAGNFGLLRGEIGVGGALVPDKIAVRAAGYFVDRGGFGKNEVTGKDVNTRSEQAGRLTVDLTPTDAFSLEIIGDYFQARDSSAAVHQHGRGVPGVPTVGEFTGNVPSTIWNISSATNPLRNVKVWGVQGTASLDLSDSMSLKSITAYRESHYKVLDDLTGNNPTLQLSNQSENQHQFSNEVQFLANGDRWDLILGAYYFTENVDGISNISIFGGPAQFDQRGSEKTNAYAVFAHGSYELVDKVKLIVGARYSEEKKTSLGSGTFGFPPAIPTGGRAKFNSFTPKVTLQYEPTANLSLYAGVSKGFKSGGFTIGAPGPAVQPETLWSYEAGVKAQMFDRRLTANVAAFWYDYKDMVVTRIVGAQTIDENAGKATIKGIEFELTARPIDNLRIDASLGLLDPKFDQYTSADPLNTAAGVISLAGNQLPGAAKYAGRLGAVYDIPVGDRAMISIGGDMTFSGNTYFDPFEHKTASQPAYELYNANLTYDSGGPWAITAWIRNITDKTIISSEAVSADFLGFPRLAYLRDPQTYGIDLKFKF